MLASQNKVAATNDWLQRKKHADKIPLIATKLNTNRLTMYNLNLTHKSLWLPFKLLNLTFIINMCIKHGLINGGSIQQWMPFYCAFTGCVFVDSLITQAANDLHLQFRLSDYMDFVAIYFNTGVVIYAQICSDYIHTIWISAELNFH